MSLKSQITSNLCHGKIRPRRIIQDALHDKRGNFELNFFSLNVHFVQRVHHSAADPSLMYVH